jgi:GTP-binding protein LepA
MAIARAALVVSRVPACCVSMLVHRGGGETRVEEWLKSCAEKAAPALLCPIQAGTGSRIVAHETIEAYRKDLIATCYGGDISRERGLLEQQQRGKKRVR